MTAAEGIEITPEPLPEGALDNEQEVLAGILPSNRAHLVAALLQLDAKQHFLDPVNRDIFVLLRKYYDRTGEVLPLTTLSKTMALNNWAPARIIVFEQAYTALEKRAVLGHQFKWALFELKEEARKRLTGEAIQESMEILERGLDLVGEDALALKKKVAFGHEDARAFLSARLASIARAGEAEAAPEGDIRNERKAILQDYVDRRDGKLGVGVKTGIRVVDDTTGGMQNGELVLHVAYTGQGKSMLSTQTAWYTAWGCTQDGIKGRPVFFATSETVRSQVIRRVLARHSRLPQFGAPGGLNSKSLKDGTLTPAEEKIYAAVLDDVTNNPNYGALNIVQIPRGATVSYIEQRLREFGREHEVALCVVDYLALIRPASRRESRREEFDEIINDAKLMATSFNNGQGVPVLSPWSVNQTAFRQGMQSRSYTLASLSETSVAEKSADQIMCLLRDEDEYKEARLQWLKVRDGDLPVIQEIEIDFRSTYLGDRQGSAVFAPGGTVSDIEDLLS